MAWYDTGTVSVTNGSTAVTGSGTNFVAGAQVGEGFYGPDGRLYEIQAIVSATSLTLADAYLGTTQTGQEYKIVPTQSLVADLASQVSTLISDYQSVADNAGEGKFQDGSATSPGITFTLDQDTGFFRDTANEIGISAGGVKVGEFNSTGMTIDALTVSGDLTFGGLSGSLTFGSITGDLTGDVTGNVTGDLTGDVDLAAIAASKAVTAVDVFVYDTSKDSDGGAWRKRTQHTSWYNETLNTATRGSRREFPAVAVIVAESNKVTIYDGDDPALPMWMVFEGASTNAISSTIISSVSAVNGIVSVGTSAASGMFALEFLKDRSFRYNSLTTTTGYYNGTLLDRNATKNFTYGFLQAIVNANVNDVAMTVLPNAPIDAATGLPVPTIAVATAGGVSVITDSGAVYDTTVGFTPVQRVAFDSIDGGLYWTRNASAFLSYATVSDYSTADGFGDLIASSTIANQEFDILSGIGPNDLVVNGNLAALGDTDGFEQHYLDTSALTASLANSLSNLTTSTYNTGWMNGDIKLATLSDTDATNVTGSELVTNGTFDSASNWTIQGDAINWTITGGVASGSAAEGSIYSDSFTTVAGETYVISFEVSNWVDGQVYVSEAEDTGTGQYVQGNGAYSKTFIASDTSTYVNVRARPSDPFTGDIDNISVRLAEEDRSVNGNGLQVFGTVTRSPVATGAELVAYSAFNSTNYLEQPYNSDLDFGTGDFCVMGWVNYGSGGWLFERINPAGTGNYIRGIASGGVLSFRAFSSAASTLTGTRNVNDDSWHMFTYCRSAGQEMLFVDGILDATITQAADNISANNQNLRVGVNSTGLNPFNGSLALIRISATAPTAEQIKKIYEDEKVLFQENAAATLYGASDAVTALAHDSDTGLLHVGTSAGRSVFQGLRRVSNTTTAVGTAISASGKLVVEE